MLPLSPEMAEKRGDASWISNEQIVLNAAPAQPAAKALSHISKLLATTEEDRRNGFSSGMPQIFVLSRSKSSGAGISRFGFTSSCSFSISLLIGTSWGRTHISSQGAGQETHGDFSGNRPAAVFSLSNQILRSISAGLIISHALLHGAS